MGNQELTDEEIVRALSELGPKTARELFYYFFERGRARHTLTHQKLVKRLSRIRGIETCGERRVEMGAVGARTTVAIYTVSATLDIPTIRS